MRWCPNPNCKGAIRGQTLDDKIVICSKCQTKVCFSCRGEGHEGKTCEKALEDQLEGWAAEKGGVKFCPVCRSKIEKNEGCNHMTCVVCKYEFCWNCLGYAGSDADHFSNLNPDNCGV